MGYNESIRFQDTQPRGEDKSSETAQYRIITYGADFTLEVLDSKLAHGEIVIPPFQRRFVWSLKRASRLIESFLLGLPVPQVFLYREEKKQDLLVVDGHQRLKSIQFFFSEKFDGGETFRLRGVKLRWEGKKFSDLPESEQRYLKNSVLRATIFEQTDPKDHTSMFEVFNRLNTGGMALSSQEIRNCLYRGEIGPFLNDLNGYEKWRSILGSVRPDKRMRDVEMILRFFALKDRWKKYTKTMRDFLSSYMADNEDLDEKKRGELAELFKKCIDKVYNEIGSSAFRIQRGMNIAVFDSVMVALTQVGIDNIKDLKSKYKKLLLNETYREYVSKWTSDTDRVTGRIKVATGIFS